VYPPVEVRVPPTTARNVKVWRRALRIFPVSMTRARAFYSGRESPYSWLSLSKPDFSPWVDIY
jgi:hypothetical protein